MPSERKNTVEEIQKFVNKKFRSFSTLSITMADGEKVKIINSDLLVES